MKLCTETITVVNEVWDAASGHDVYVGTVIRGVSWFRQTAANVDDKGLRAANTFTIRIPEDADFGGKTYVDPLTYKESDPANTFTLANGDAIVHGEVTGEIPGTAALRETYPEVVLILGVTDNRRVPRGKHFKVVGA